MDDVKAKQQVVEKIKAATNILITVSNDPSVDSLSAAIGMTLLLDKLDKHATAVFSGTVPPALAFLEPEKVLDDTTDSLRDFIIALDKEKADHLRYKVEGDSVKIFITPYKTTITSDDLEFSQGDFNVELVIALGVDNQDHLDKAIEDHGQILHDATIITATAGDDTSTLGGIDWHDAQATSLSEMMAGLAEALKTDKNNSLLDPSIATAFLTGIVAETDRFSNVNTTSRVMTVAAQLMAGGADQQLIAAKLQEAPPAGIGVHSATEATESDDEQDEPSDKEEPEKSDPTTLNIRKDDKPTLGISLKPNETLEELDKRVKAAEQAEAANAADEALGEQKSDAPAPEITETHDSYAPEEEAEEPTLGGTLNATAEQAAEDARNAEEDDRNKTILTHSYIDTTPTYGPPTMSGATVDTANEAGLDMLAPSKEPEDIQSLQPATDGEVHSAYAAMEPEPANAAPAPQPAPVAPSPADLGLPMPPAVPDFSQAPAPAPAYGLDSSQPARLGDILAPEPQAPVEPLPTPPSEPAPIPPTPSPVPPVEGPNDPGQFKIPGQQ